VTLPVLGLDLHGTLLGPDERFPTDCVDDLCAALDDVATLVVPMTCTGNDLSFVADVLQAEKAGGLLLALYFVAGAASLPLWVALAGRIGRVRAWLLSMGLAGGAFAWAGMLGAGDVVPFAAICLASGLALGADLALPAAMAADLGERRRQAGTCFGIWNFAAKLNLALAAGLALPLLGLLGYTPGGGEALAALSFSYALLPLAFKALAAALLWHWRLSLEIDR